MANQLADTFRAGIVSARAKLQHMSEAEAGTPLKHDGWNSKHVLGHLIDSALNNHQRFVRAALEGKYDGPGYQQQGWVDMHGYGEMAWPALVAHWQRQNDLLCAVVARIPEDKLGGPCKIGTDAPVTLRFVVEDYLVHLHDHADSIEAAVSPGRLFIGYSVEKMRLSAKQIRECVQGLSDEQIWARSGENANSIGNLILHVAGNIRQWIGHGVGGLADVRERDKEFAARGGRPTAEILSLFETTLTDAVRTIEETPLQRLTERIKPQNRDVAVLEAIYQVVGHLQLHMGQIIFATKQLTGKDLGFFKP